jgi:hypothetical protein
MVHRKPNIGWCLLAMASFAWLGCGQLAVRAPQAQDSPSLLSAQGPEPAEPLQIADRGPPSATNITRASLQGPVSADHLEPVPAGPASPRASDSPLRTLHRLAFERFVATPGYLARFHRRELINGREQPEELILFKYRRDPNALYMRWLGNEARGRELLYARGQYDDMIFVLPGVGESGWFQVAGRAVLRRPDTPQGLGKERHAVAEFGIGPWINQFGRLVEAFERGDPKAGTVKYLGGVKRPEFETPVEAVMHFIPPGAESGLPDGGQRLWFFDPTHHFPVLLIAHDAAGREVEYYCLDQIYFPAHFQAGEFDPGNLGKR